MVKLQPIMEQPKPTNVKKGLHQVLFLAVCILISHFEKKDNTIEQNTETEKYQTIYVNEKNYRQLLTKNWIMCVNLTGKACCKRNIAKVNKLCNVAILTPETIFTCKLLASFKPKQCKDIFLLSNGKYYGTKGIEEINIRDDVSMIDVLELYFIHKLNIISEAAECVIKMIPSDTKFYILMYIFEFYIGLGAK